MALSTPFAYSQFRRYFPWAHFSRNWGQFKLQDLQRSRSVKFHPMETELDALYWTFNLTNSKWPVETDVHPSKLGITEHAPGLLLALIMMKTNDKETVLLTWLYHMSPACQSLIRIEYIHLPILSWHASSDRAQTCISVFILQCQEILVCLYTSSR